MPEECAADPSQSADHAKAAATASFTAVDLAFDSDSARRPATELAWGEGYALAVEVGLPDDEWLGRAVELSAQYARSEHREVRTSTRSELHLATLSFSHLAWWVGGEDFGVGPRLCCGVGVAVADHAATGPDDQAGLTGSLGIDIEVRAFRHLLLRVGGRGLVMGYPTNTLATGGVMLLGGGIMF